MKTLTYPSFELDLASLFNNVEKIKRVFDRNVMRLFFLVAFGLGLAGLLFFSLRPAHENAGRTKGLPKALSRWVNSHDNLANILAYAGMGILAMSLAAKPLLGGKNQNRDATCRKYRNILLSMGAMVVVIEIAQIWIPGRVADPMDVLSAWFGLMLSWVAVALLARLRASADQ